MTTAAPSEEILLQILDRLTRQERRAEAIEAALARLAPPSARSYGNGSAASTETPLEIPWPRRDVRDTTARNAERIRELEARLAEAEERLRIAARLEVVGRLVAGVAHDFNNLLTIITGHADVIRTELPEGHSLRETAEMISSAAHTAAGVTRQLVEFGKPGRPDPCPVDVNAAVRDLERTLGRLTSNRVTLTFTLASSLPLIRIDPGQFDQVLLNLVVNARDAIRDSGTITIRTAAATILAGRAGWPLDVAPGEFVVVTVTDTGIGMTEEVKARIFDLFFTTKAGRGSGLGLATVKDIIKGTGGHVEVESSPDWGTSVRVFWPAYPEPQQTLKMKW
jgi:signal transduction histidine kinase